MDLLINSYGTRIRSSGERIILAYPGYKAKYRAKKEYPIRSLEKIIILRPSSISTGAVQLALEAGVDIVYLNYFGTPVGRIFASSPKGLAELRKAQVVFSNSPKALELARTFVLGKGANQVAHLKQLQRHHGVSFVKEIVQCETMLDSLNLRLDNEIQRGKLFGAEGYIAEKYFACLGKLHVFPGRKPRGQDKFNSALNYGYGILYNEVERACLYVGLDPYMGLYHAERYGKPSLVLDLVEEYRVPIVDSMVFPLFLTGQMEKAENYQQIQPGSYRLSNDGKRKIVEAVYTRFNEQVFWDGKWREVKAVIRHQMQRLAQHFLDKRDRYEPFRFSVVKKPWVDKRQLSLNV
jgi:CRISP-associated protein Cas1